MSTLLDRLRGLIIDGELKPNDVLLLSLVAGRLEHLEFTNNGERDARLRERIESLEAVLSVANDCIAEATRGAKVEREAAGLLLKHEKSRHIVKDTRKGEYPKDDSYVHMWSGYEWMSRLGCDVRVPYRYWLPAPPPPTDD